MKNRFKLFFLKHLKYSSKFIQFSKLKWTWIVNNDLKIYKNNSFEFLNIKHQFKDKIDWNLGDYGLLWTFNLNYFDFLNQKDITKEKGIKLITDFIDNYSLINQGKQSYPTSSRIINITKFICSVGVFDNNILELLREDSNRLRNNLEFHLQANHLLENLFALWFSSKLFNDINLGVS